MLQQKRVESAIVPIGKISDKEFIFKMKFSANRVMEIMLDFLCVCEKSDKKEVGITEEARNVIPKVECENDHIKISVQL